MDAVRQCVSQQVIMSLFENDGSSGENKDDKKEKKVKNSNSIYRVRKVHKVIDNSKHALRPFFGWRLPCVENSCNVG